MVSILCLLYRCNLHDLSSAWLAHRCAVFKLEHAQLSASSDALLSSRHSSPSSSLHDIHYRHLTEAFATATSSPLSFCHLPEVKALPSTAWSLSCKQDGKETSVGLDSIDNSREVFDYLRKKGELRYERSFIYVPNFSPPAHALPLNERFWSLGGKGRGRRESTRWKGERVEGI